MRQHQRVLASFVRRIIGLAHADADEAALHHAVQIAGPVCQHRRGQRVLGLFVQPAFHRAGGQRAAAVKAQAEGPLSEAYRITVKQDRYAKVNEIKAAGGEAMSNGGNVAEYEQMVEMVARAKEAWGSVHILINNAGILRDKTFAKMDLADFRLVLDVHLMGAVNCTHAVWPVMRAQKYGRIVMTTSSTGLYGNFGQTNYGAAKLALVGLMQTLAIEGERQGIRVNSLAPTAATRMTEGLMPPEVLAALKRLNPGLPPEAYSQALAQVLQDDIVRGFVNMGGGKDEA